MVELIITKKVRLFVADDKVEEAKRDYAMQTDPRNFITFNDGYHERSIRNKYGFGSADLGVLLKYIKKLERSKKHG